MYSQQSYAFLPCAPGCQGSRNDSRYCTCACQGINHGIAWTRQAPRPIPVPYGYNPNIPLAQLPELTPRLEAKPEIVAYANVPKPETERLIFPVARESVKVGKKLGKLFLKSIGHVSERELNERILKGLHDQFKPENVEIAIDQAFQIFYQRMGPEANRPELYELYENDDLDKALALFGKRWVIGRPKRK